MTESLIPAAPVPPPETYLTEEEAARVLDVAPRTIRLWRRTRGLPHVKVSRRIVRIPRGELDRWMSLRQVRMVA